MKRWAPLVAGVFLLALLMVGCGAPQASDVSFSVEPVDWNVTLVKSGGIMGVSRSVQIASSGEVTLKDLRSNLTTQSKLTPAELATLAGLVLSANPDGPAQPSQCADCFIYDVKINLGDEIHELQFDDSSLAGSPLQPLVEFLARFVE